MLYANINKYKPQMKTITTIKSKHKQKKIQKIKSQNSSLTVYFNFFSKKNIF